MWSLTLSNSFTCLCVEYDRKYIHFLLLFLFSCSLISHLYAWTRFLFFTDKHVFKWPDIFPVGLISRCDAVCLTSFTCAFLFPFKKKVFLFIFQKRLLFHRALFADSLRRYNHFLRDLTENTSPDNPEFQQLSSKSFRLSCLAAYQTLSHPCDKKKCWWVHPVGIIFIVFLFVKICIKTVESESPKATLITHLLSILVCQALFFSFSFWKRSFSARVISLCFCSAKQWYLGPFGGGKKRCRKCCIRWQNKSACEVWSWQWKRASLVFVRVTNRVTLGSSFIVHLLLLSQLLPPWRLQRMKVWRSLTWV